MAEQERSKNGLPRAVPQQAVDRLAVRDHLLSTRQDLFGPQCAQERMQTIFAECAGDDSINIIRQFSLLIAQGLAPPSHVLIAVANFFLTYLASADDGHEISLDCAFNLQRKQRSGHALTQRKEQEKRGREIYLMWSLIQTAKSNGQTLSIEAAAGQVIGTLDLKVGESALTKSYKSMKADLIFGGMLQAFEEGLGKNERK